MYYQLVLEGHFLLKSKLALPRPSYGTVGVGLGGLPSQSETGLTSGMVVDAAVALNMNIEAQNNRALLRRSSTLLANVRIGCFESGLSCRIEKDVESERVEKNDNARKKKKNGELIGVRKKDGRDW